MGERGVTIQAKGISTQDHHMFFIWDNASLYIYYVLICLKILTWLYGEASLPKNVDMT
jgi:hypothetical protein